MDFIRQKVALLAALFFLCAAAAAAAEEYTIMLMGDSAVITSYLSGADTIHYKLLEKLKKAKPDRDWKIVNAGKDGETIGPAPKKIQKAFGVSCLFEMDNDGRYEAVTENNPDVDMALIRYGGNDSKIYKPEVFKEKLKRLCAKLKQKYAGVKIVLESSMYVDFPRHAAPYYRENSRVKGFKQGSSRNDYTKPFYEAARQLAAEEKYPFIDVYGRLESLTKKGNWDFRMRSDGTTKDASLDSGKDAKWFDNIHPSPNGCEAIAQVESENIISILYK
ncbi:MAG: GDSL-type esterase/lipase family protein [Candidatus Firestonebacteria bacterium]